jgi:hypothetical protein|tara:strand:+ start:159 stop:656 length:498 start_codon:yes stop_codon:yes gene_type:complete
MIHNNFYYFILTWPLFVLLDDTFIVDFQPYLDPSLVSVIFISILSSNKFFDILLFLSLVIMNLFGSDISIVDFFIKILVFVIGRYLSINYIWKNYLNEIYLIGFLVFTYYLISIILIFVLSSLDSALYLIYMPVSIIYNIIVLSIILIIVKYIRWPNQYDQTYQF